jgi:Kef-type K+ transport system membrane component KefB
MTWLALITENPFYEFAIILALAALLGVIGQFLRQPLIVMFIALGILVGPCALDIVKSKDNIHLLAEIGISILLFIVGLKLDLRIIQSVGKIALMTGLGQVVFTSLFGYFIGLALGFSNLHSFYIAVALTFSSTIIIVKLLSDKKEIDSLHGQIAIGFLIVQDIVVILVMIILTTLKQNNDANLAESIIKTIISGTGLILLTASAMRWVLPRLSNFLAKSQELLVLFAIAWAVGLATTSELIGFSSEVGAFLAGMSLASSEFREVISNKLVSLRDFLLLFFFVNLGSELDLSIIGEQIPAALIFSVFVLVGNPIIVLIIMGIMGYRKRTSFLAGLAVAQISEFSLIFAGLGYSVGHINSETVGLITLVGLITIGLSTYMIIYSHELYEFLSPALGIFESKNPYRENQHRQEEKIRNFDFIILGLGRFGKNIADILDQNHSLSYLGVDFDPSIVDEWQKAGKNIIYGDIGDPDLLEQIPFNNTKIIINTNPDFENSKQLVQALRLNKYSGKVYLTANNEKSYEMLKSCGSDEVLMPHKMAAQYLESRLVSG